MRASDGISPRRRRRRGSSLVESALILLPMLAIMFGIIDFSMVIFLRGLFQMAAREAVRYAITYSTTFQGASCGTQTACIKQVVQANTMNFLAGTTGANYIAVNYYAPNNLSTPLTAGSLPITLANGTVVQFVNQTGNVVEVQISNFPWNWMIPMAGFMPGRSITISAASSDVLQGLPVGTFTPPSP